MKQRMLAWLCAGILGLHACNRWNSNGCICVPVEKAEILQPEIRNGESPSNSVETELERKCIALWQIIPDNPVLYAKSHSNRRMMLLFAQNAERLIIGRAGSITGTASMCICTKTAEAGSRSKFHYQNRKQHQKHAAALAAERKILCIRRSADIAA